MNTTTVLICGGYTHTDAAGIHLYDASDPDGALTDIGAFDQLEHPSYLAIHPELPIVYAVSEVAEFDGQRGGGIVALAVDIASGTIDELDRISSLGTAPCHLSIAADGSGVFVANYGSGSVSAYALKPDGHFGPLRRHHQHRGAGPHPRQDAPHAHCVRPDPSGRSLFALDLGTDEIVRYDLDDRDLDRCDATSATPGAGPRQITFHPSDPRAFVVNELDNSITAYATDEPDGGLRPLATASTLPDAATPSIAADIQIHPEGHRIYASNRGHDSIAIFDCADPDDPLRPLGQVDSGGRTPRATVLHPSTTTFFVANQDSDTIVAFTVDPDGILHERGVSACPSAPTCLVTSELAS